MKTNQRKTFKFEKCHLTLYLPQRKLNSMITAIKSVKILRCPVHLRAWVMTSSWLTEGEC
jgi:hypothetical protein